jgi:hypothetical protein
LEQVSRRSIGADSGDGVDAWDLCRQGADSVWKEFARPRIRPCAGVQRTPGRTASSSWSRRTHSRNRRTHYRPGPWVWELADGGRHIRPRRKLRDQLLDLPLGLVYGTRQHSLPVVDRQMRCQQGGATQVQHPGREVCQQRRVRSRSFYFSASAGSRWSRAARETGESTVTDGPGAWSEHDSLHDHQSN